MKKLLAAMFVALLMVGCGEEAQKPAEDSPESNESSAETPPAKSPEVGGIDLDDKETREKIIAEAIDFEILQHREDLFYNPKEQTPYTGWVKEMYDNGVCKALGQFKDGKEDGLQTTWYENGQREREGNFRDGKMDGVWTFWHENGQVAHLIQYKGGTSEGLETVWYKNGKKHMEGNYKGGKEDGLFTSWYENGKKRSEDKFKDGKLMSAEVWLPNGEKCPVTNVKDGNGVWVYYNDDGTESFRKTYKDGKVVED